MESIKQQRINKQIAKISPTTGSLIRMHDSDIETKDKENEPSFKITKTALSLKQIKSKMAGKYKWITTSLDPATGSQLIKARYPKLNNALIAKKYDLNQIITFKSQGEYVTWIR